MIFLWVFSNDQDISSTWPNALPAGWTMEWEPSTSHGLDEWCHVRAYHGIYPTKVVYSYVIFSAVELLLSKFLLNLFKVS